MRLGTGKFFMALAALVVMVGLGGCGSMVQSGGNEGGGQQNQEQGSQEQAGQQDQAAAEESAPQDDGSEAVAPEDPTLSLSVPKAGINIESIPTGRGDNAQLLTENAAVHVFPTGFPWQEGANTFLAGHVEGYEGTPSYKAFDGIQQLQNGDQITVTDANGTEYVYEVYNTEITTPDNVEILDPVPGRSIVTLQTCEIVNVNPDGTPDYSNTERYIVQGELVS